MPLMALALQAESVSVPQTLVRALLIVSLEAVWPSLVLKTPVAEARVDVQAFREVSAANEVKNVVHDELMPVGRF